MAEPPKKQKCKNCRFFEKGRPDSKTDGTCMRHPPVRLDTSDTTSYWACVSEDEWCGEWSPANPETVEEIAGQLARHVLLGDMTAAHALVDRLMEIRNG